MLICFFFLLSSIGWVAELHQDRADIGLCTRAPHPKASATIRLAQGSGFHVYR